MLCLRWNQINVPFLLKILKGFASQIIVGRLITRVSYKLLVDLLLILGWQKDLAWLDRIALPALTWLRTNKIWRADEMLDVVNFWFAKKHLFWLVFLELDRNQNCILRILFLFGWVTLLSLLICYFFKTFNEILYVAISVFRCLFDIRAWWIIFHIYIIC